MKLVSIALVLVAATGCKKHPAEAPAKGSGAGDAMGPTNPADASPPKPVTSAQISERFEECWGFRNDGKWDALESCYANDAVYDLPGFGMPALTGNAAIVAAVEPRKVAFPDLKGATALDLIHGHDVVAITLITGTNTGPMKMPDGDQPATNNKVGFFTSEVLALDDLDHITHESEYLDTATLIGQLHPSKDHPVRAIVSALPSPKEVVISANDDKENANLLADKKFIDAFNKHDIKAFEGALDNDLVWSEAPESKDLDKKGIVAGTTAFWKGFSDIAIAATSQWAAGAYTVLLGDLTGTNDGDIPMMKLEKTGKPIKIPFLQIDKYDNGKLRNVWLFYQSMAFAQQLGLTKP